jgi:predicted kinase
MDWVSFGASGRLDWDAVEAEFPPAAAMRVCIQDPVFHGEGDVWTHTRMVGEALFADPEFASLPRDRKVALALAVLFHDVEKPATRAVEPFEGRERVTHHGHSRRGAVTSWHMLWERGVPRAVREQVFSLVMAHQRVFHIFGRTDPRAEIARFSIVGSWRELIMLAKADNRGRIAPNTAQTERQLELTRMLAEEHGCLDATWPFPSDQARLRFARGAADALFYDPPRPAGSHLVVLCGPPGSGKDTYAQQVLGDYPQVSLDLMREELDVKATDNQGAVAQAVLEGARKHLRAKRPFVFNATNITRQRRDRIVDLGLAYDALIDIRAFDIPEPLLRKRNRERPSAVPEKVLDRMIAKWEPPTLAEGHVVSWIGPAAAAARELVSESEAVVELHGARLS